MSASEVMDQISQVLLRDGRILTDGERKLLTDLTRNANQSGDAALTDKLARAIGETIAQRAFGLLGSSITRQLLQPREGESNGQRARIYGKQPQPPPTRPPGQAPPSPPPPSPSPGSVEHSQIFAGAALPQFAGIARDGDFRLEELLSAADQIPASGKQPQPPAPHPPGQSPAATPAPPSSLPTPSSSQAQRPDLAAVAVMELPEILPAECVVLDEFLAPAELQALTQSVLAREAEFRISEVISPGVPGDTIDFEHRRSRVLMDIGAQGNAVAERVRSLLPRLLPRLSHDPFTVRDLETQITASNDGDFFRWHNDNGSEAVAKREVTFVYFFHREPRQFRGGELRIYDSLLDVDQYVPSQNYRTIVPQQNQLVVFNSSLAHEITAIECPSRAFADSRFTVNGWFHR